MIPHFMLIRGKKEYLIIRMGDVFHIIDADESLTKEKRLAILEKGCTPAGMQERGLSGLTIPKRDIKTLTVTGCGSQDDVIFRLEKEKLAFRFKQAYDQRRVDDFFRGIPRKQYKTRTRLKGGRRVDWRIREQNPLIYERLRPVGWIFHLVCIAMFFLPFSQHYTFAGWSAALLALTVTALMLDLFGYKYFSLIPTGRRKHGEAPKRAVNLSYGLIPLLALFTAACNTRYYMLDHTKVLIGALLLTAILGGLLMLCREFREEFGKWFAALALLLAVSFFGIVPHFNHILGHDLHSETATVVSIQRVSGRRSSTKYYATLRLNDGREIVVRISDEDYTSHKAGDSMDIRIGTGFFGIEYGMDA